MILGFVGGLIDGLRTLWDGLWRLPGLALDPGSYDSFLTYLNDREGLDEVLGVTIDHAKIVLTAEAMAIVIGLTLGIVIHRVGPLRAPVLGIVAIFLTIPSLALFAVFVPIVGIGNTGPIIALTMYSLLPITRNTVTGLEEVDRAVVESAKGMGLSPLQRLVRVEMPLAWPVILTGIRVSTLLATGIAAIAVLVGGDGLGEYIRDGLGRYPLPNSVEAIWVAVVFTVGLALLFDLAFSLLKKLTTSRGIQ